MTKDLSIMILKFGVLSLLGFCLPAVALAEAGSLWFEVSEAEASERGIGVTPAKIEIASDVEWPYTVPLTVTNLSSESERFEVLFEKDTNIVVSAEPGRFSLENGATQRVLVTFEKPRKATEGLVKVLSTQTTPEGFTTGTGVKIPFHIEAQGDNAKFLAGVREAFGGFLGFRQLFGAGMIFATLLLLWYLSDIARTWIFNSDKH